MRLENKIALVTGGGLGIGSGIAQMFAQEGALVMVVDINQDEGQETVRRINSEGGQARFVQADISKVDDVQRAVHEVVATWDRLDVLVNNAGIVRLGSVTETSIEDWDAVMAINLRGTFLCSRFALKQMIQQGSGVIINIGSVGGLRGSRELAAYATAKAGVINLTRQMANDYGRYNIRVNCICPEQSLRQCTVFGIQKRRQEATLALWAKNRPLNMAGEPKDIAYPAVYLASNEARFVTGSVVVVDGGATAGSSG